VSLDRTDGFFNTFDKWSKLIAKFGEPIARRRPDYEMPPQVLFQLGETAVNGRLAYRQHLRRRNRAAAAGDSQEVPKVVPSKHGYANLT
jgi:hypothetical protein